METNRSRVTRIKILERIRRRGTDVLWRGLLSRALAQRTLGNRCGNDGGGEHQSGVHGGFVWALLEPRKGMFDFAWLDEAIAVLGRHGIFTVLGTPTATPPKWLMDRHTDILSG